MPLPTVGAPTNCLSQSLGSWGTRPGSGAPVPGGGDRARTWNRSASRWRRAAGSLPPGRARTSTVWCSRCRAAAGDDRWSHACWRTEEIWRPFGFVWRSSRPADRSSDLSAAFKIPVNGVASNPTAHFPFLSLALIAGGATGQPLTHGLSVYLPSHRASPPTGQYQIIKHGDRGTKVCCMN